ncbi:MAG: hypothetical protein HY320_00665 [Armatimonadetes bacterium]|nr:hypothetical protein [Armatimonadota bacterium]
MPRALPPNPSLRHLREQAKDILRAQRSGDALACGALRLLRRFKDAPDDQILASHVSLHEAQYALALDYGLRSWTDLHEEVRRRRSSGLVSLEAALLRCEEEVPEYAGAGVPLAYVAALSHAGCDVDFHDFAAGTGWAFSFAYRYDDISPAYMAVRGDPAHDGPYEVFWFLPELLGFRCEMARTSAPDELWQFATRHVDRARRS